LNIIVQISSYSGEPDLTQKPNKSIFVVLDRFLELKVTSNITSPIHRGSLTYIDRAGELIDFIGDDNVFITITVNRWADMHGPDSASPVFDSGVGFNHIFVVDKFEILEHNLQQDTIKIDFTSINYFLLLQNCVYATSQQLDAITILNGIFGSALPNSELILPTNYSSSTSKKMSYISTINSSLMDSIEYIINYGFDPNDGPIFLTHDISAGNFILWMQKYWDNDDLHDPSQVSQSVRYTAYIPSRQKYTQMEQLFCDEITLKNLVTTTSIYNKTKDFTEKTFDFTTGTFIPTPYSQNAIINLLSKKQTNSLYLPKIRTWLPKGIGLKTNASFATTRTIANYEELLSSKIKSVLLDNNVLAIKTNGWPLRTPGDPFLLIGNTAFSMRMSVNMLVGRWTVAQVNHIFRPNEYKNELVLVRNEKIADKNMIEYLDVIGGE
jgi:hypothetical protein